MGQGTEVRPSPDSRLSAGGSQRAPTKDRELPSLPGQWDGKQRLPAGPAGVQAKLSRAGVVLALGSLRVPYSIAPDPLEHQAGEPSPFATCRIYGMKSGGRGPRLGTLVFFASRAGLDIEFTGLRSNLSRPQQIR